MAREAIIQEDTIIKGKIRNCRQMEIHGYVEGELAAESVIVHQGGTFFGTLKTDQADVAGSLQGEVFVKNLISIRSSGVVNGNVRYGQLAMEMGADLSAELRNVPPKLAGDLDVTVKRGRSVVITTEDLTAIDPDDSADELSYAVSNASNGIVALAANAGVSVDRFTQADIEAGRVLFVHDGGDSNTASFDVLVSDESGANSGRAQTVHVTVRG
ncbi:polymer-forming cytoskeletal protein [Rhodomicrobium lacus]|uniref:polymer-forming cytoskeletal protein n=1 Tax=Rhodomicrobium lacus TaxID=2498452 RepID=UPI0026E29A95|nr:polymer-forming cytoskeletal protein [Rhodomicrobium lacus]WKW49457.1 cadherin-like domain-containing protein [Rhodomicrobium lacus]